MSTSFTSSISASSISASSISASIFVSSISTSISASSFTEIEDNTRRISITSLMLDNEISNSLTLDSVLKKLYELKNVSKSYIPKIDLYIVVIQTCVNIENGIIIDKYFDKNNMKSIMTQLTLNISLSLDWINRLNCMHPQIKKRGKISFHKLFGKSDNNNDNDNDKDNDKDKDKDNNNNDDDVKYNIKIKSPGKNTVTLIFPEEINKSFDDIIKIISSKISVTKLDLNINDTIQEIKIESKVNFPLIVDSTGPMEKPYDPIYGGDFKSKLAMKFVIPCLNVLNKTFDGVLIKSDATDQGWGGTGQTHLRYFVNDKWFGPSFYINRDININNNSNYSFTIKKEYIKSGDIVTLWLCCPGWAGWKAILNNITAELIYV